MGVTHHSLVHVLRKKILLLVLTEDRSVIILHTIIKGMSPIEAFATAIKFFDRQKVCLIS